MPLPCSNDNGKITGQHLFLGATVLSFNVNMGWGGNPASLTVELIDDKQPITCYDPVPYTESSEPLRVYPQFTFSDNHYLTCTGDDCYNDEIGRRYNIYNDPKPKEKRVPGKVYYTTNSQGEFVSKYWYLEDPGFFATGTSIQYDGFYDPDPKKITSYDIIGIYVVFKLDNFIFSGIVKSWEKNDRPDGLTYTVNIESVDTILNNAYIILSHYGGAIFGQDPAKVDMEGFGFPTNYYGDLLEYSGQITKGNLPNIFNVFGFLESFDDAGFGGSQKNDEGIPAYMISEALAVLTSSISSNPSDPGQRLFETKKRAFSPFGRLLTKTMQEENTYNIILPNFGTFGCGVIPPVLDKYNIPRTSLMLDLSELPAPPRDYRISAQYMTIADFLRQITSDTGRDFFCVGIPAKYDNKPLNIIKVKVIDRTAQPVIGSIAKTVQDFKNANVPIINSNLGVESNTNSPRALYIGGEQQRLYQAKNYRLGYSQTNYVYNPATHRFVDFDRFQRTGPIDPLDPLSMWKKQAGKIRIPAPLSTRNQWLSININGEDLTELWDAQENIKYLIDTSEPMDRDEDWKDTEIGGSDNVAIGNYNKSKQISRTELSSGRFLPLYEDVISPFFGYQLEETVEIDTGGESNNFRRIRPVFLDKWTGNINVTIDVDEVPLVSLGKMRSIRQIYLELTGQIPYTPPGFAPPPVIQNPFVTYPINNLTITETEMRCQSFDSYFEYCMLKSGPTKPDLFVMLLYTYMRANKPIFTRIARDVNVQVQNQAQANGALPAQGGMGAAGQPIPPQQGNMNNNNNLDWTTLLDKDFIKDLERLHAFIQNIARYYGKKYMIRLPEIATYKDSKYADLELPGQNGNIYIFKGSGKIFYNYEPCDAGWEEPGNMIDDSLVIGSAPSYILMNDNGTYSTILGYNATDSFDRVRRSLCSMQINNAAAYISGKSITNLNGDSGGSDPPRDSNLYWRKSVIRYDLEQIWKHLSLDTCDDRNFLFPSLDLSQLDKNNYIVLDTATGRDDAYGDFMAGQTDTTYNPPLAVSKKLYVATRSGASQDNIAFLEPKTLSNPRVIVDAPGLPLNPSSLIYETDPTATVISNVAIEDLMVYAQLYPVIQLNAKNNEISDSYINTLLSYVAPVIGNATLFINNTSNNQSVKHRLLSPKMAHPFFAAVPVKFNQIPYGPWTNYPAINATGLALTIPPDRDKSMARLENMITNTLVDIDTDLVPWNYGGMSFLDQYVLYKIQNNTDFLYLLESAQITIPGLPIFGIGGEFIYRVFNENDLRNKILYNTDIYAFEMVDYTYQQQKKNTNRPLPTIPIPGIPVYIPMVASDIEIIDVIYQIPKLKRENATPLAPIVSNISLSVDANGISTNYSFRTYSRKLGLYNKETSDRFKSNAINNIRRNKQIAKIKNSIVNTTNTQRQAVLEDRGGVLDVFSRFGNSPNELLIGSAFRYVDCPALRTIYQNMNNINPGYIQGPDLDLSDVPISESIRYGKDRGDADNWDSVTGIMSKSRHSTWVGNFQSKEAFGELINQYNRKSAMSMDGIFSPISFYPTLYDSTYPMAPYPRQLCPACNGSGYITDAKSTNYIDDNIYKNQTFHNYACPLCARRNLLIDNTKEIKSSQQSIEKLPPYIITSGTDISLLSNFLNSSTSSTSSVQNSTTINLYSLQPIVVPYGLFNNINAQNDKPILPNIPGGIDRCRHSIQVIARGEFPQINTNFYTNKNLLTYFNPSGVDVYGDQTIVNGNGINADYYLYDIEKNVAEGTVDKFLLNQRFFGMRGPLMMHGWGYDTEGYPVPNAADEPKEYDADGRPKRFILDSNGSNDYTKDGAFDPTTNQLGDIIGKGYKKDSGKWVKQKSKYFYLNWAERPDLWPVGPIDLRWDENRRVWVAGSSASIYKMVYITLEEDLVKEDGFDETYPARGFLDDVEYSTQALPNNARRLVYIKDRAGFTAPRGAKLLCRYDSDTGFYEPITKPQYIVFGIIGSGNTATIELSYVQGLKRGENIPTILTTFDNSKFKLKIQNGKNGMFLYSNGKWILTSVEP